MDLFMTSFDQKSKKQNQHLGQQFILKEFYLKFFPRLFKQFPRNEFLACLFLLVNQLQEIALTFSYGSSSGTLNQNNSYTPQFIEGVGYTLPINLLSTTLKYTLAVQFVFYFFLAINFTILFIIITLLIAYAIYKFDGSKVKIVARIISPFITLYNFMIFLPSTNVSIIIYFDSQFQKSDQIILSVCNTFLTWLICATVHFHDFEYSFKDSDKLSKRFSKYEGLKLVMASLLPVIYQMSTDTVLCVYSIAFACLKIYIYVRDQTYNNQNVSRFYIQLNVFYLCACVIYFICQQANWNSLDFTVLILISLPLSAKLGAVIQEYLEKDVFSKCMGQANLNHIPPQTLDIFIRLLNKNLSFFYEDYIDRGQGILFENLYVNHQINCEVSDYRCFCNEFRRADNKLDFEEYIGQDFRKKYVMFYIVSLFEQYLESNVKNPLRYNEVMFAYISFLFEIMKISTKSFNTINIFSMRLASNPTVLIDLFYEQVLTYRIRKEFEHFFSNPIYQNQRLYILGPILFDENLVKMQTLLKEQIINTAVFYDYLCQNYVDLNQVAKNARKLHKKLQELKKVIIFAFDLNAENQFILYLAQYYSTFLEFENPKPISFKHNSKNIAKRMLKPKDKSINVFSKYSCVVYASLIKKDGLIKKVTDSFSRIYGIDNQFIIGKTLNSLIPKGLYNAHDDIISNFKNKGSMNIINKETRTVFGLNGEGFIVPLLIRLKLENMEDDFGVCALLTQVNFEKEYLFISDEGMIMDITKKLYNRIFRSISTVNDLRSFDIKHFIPLIWGINVVGEFDKPFNSIMIIQHNRIQQSRLDKKKEFKGLNDYTRMQSLVDSIGSNDEIYKIQFRICIITTSIGKNFKYVEIDSIKREDNFIKKNKHVVNLKMCLNDFLKDENIVLFKTNSMATQIQQQLDLPLKQSNENIQEDDTTSRNSEDYTTNKYHNAPQSLADPHILNDNHFLSENEQPLSTLSRRQIYEMSPRQYDDSHNLLSQPMTNRNQISTPYFPSGLLQQQKSSLEQIQPSTQRQQLNMIDESGMVPLIQSSIQHPIPQSSFISPRESGLKGKYEFSKGKSSIHSDKHNESVSDNLDVTVQNQNEFNGSQSMHSSSRSAEESRKKYYIRLILTVYVSKALKSMAYIGTVSFILFVSLTAFFFYESDSSYSTYIDDFQKINHSTLMVVDILSVAKIYSYLSLTKTLPTYTEDLATSNKRLQFYVDQYRTFLIDFMNDSFTQDYYQFMMNQKMEMVYFHEDNSIDYASYYRSETQFLAIIKFFYYIQQLQDNMNNSDYGFIWQNIISFYSNMEQMQSIIENQASTQFDTIQFIQILMLVAVLAITSTLIFTILTIGIYNTIKCEEILRLFGCFQPEKMQKLIDVMEISVNQLENLSEQPKKVSMLSIGDQIQQQCPQVPIIQQKKLRNPNKSHTETLHRRKAKQPEYSNEMLAKDQSEYSQKTTTQKSKKSGHSTQLSNRRNPNKKGTQGLEEVKRKVPAQASVENQQQLQRQQNQQILSIEAALNSQVKIKRQAQQRTRQIASFNRLDKVDQKLVALSVLVILLMAIAPIINIIYSDLYMTEGKIMLKERTKVLDTINYLVRTQTLHYALWYESTLSNFPYSTRSTTILGYIGVILESSDDVMTGLQQILQNNVSRNNQYEYDRYYLGLLQGNQCEVLPTLELADVSEFSTEDCLSLSLGVLKQGFVLSVKYYLEIFKSAYLSYIEDINNVKVIYASYLEDAKFHDMNQSIIYLYTVFKTLDAYSSWAQGDYNEFIQNVVLGIFVCFFIVGIFIFFICWVKGYKKFKKDFNSTKQLLSLFNMSLILENAFLVNYLKNNNFGII